MYSLVYLTSPPSPSGGIWAQQTKQSPDLNITESKPALNLKISWRHGDRVTPLQEVGDSWWRCTVGICCWFKSSHSEHWFDLVFSLFTAQRSIKLFILRTVGRWNWPATETSAFHCMRLKITADCVSDSEAGNGKKHVLRDDLSSKVIMPGLLVFWTLVLKSLFFAAKSAS